MIRHILLALLVISSLLSNSQDSIISLLPDPFNLPGLQASGEPKVFKGDYLFDLMNGGADVYFEYGFVQVATQAYTGMTGKSNVKVEIYQMTNKKGAFGILSLSATGKQILENKGAFYITGTGYRMMQKGDYFIMMSYANVIENTEEDLMNRISEDIGSKIKEMANYPPILNDSKLPCNNTPRWLYFRGNIALRNATYLDFKIPFDYSDGLFYRCDVFDYIFLIPDKEKEINQMMELLIASMLESNTNFLRSTAPNGTSIIEGGKLRYDVQQEGKTVILIKYI